MSTFSGDLGREEEDGAGWGGLVPSAQEKALDRQAERIKELQLAIERDRTELCDAVSGLKKVIRQREWLGEGRGPYEWDDDRWHDEFRSTASEIRHALIPLARIAADLTNSPMEHADVVRARELIDKLRAAEARNEALLQALKEYGLHSMECNYHHGWGDKHCDCGLNALLDSGSASQEAKTPGGDNA